MSKIDKYLKEQSIDKKSWSKVNYIIISNMGNYPHAEVKTKDGTYFEFNANNIDSMLKEIQKRLKEY